MTERFTKGNWSLQFAKWAKEAPTQGFHITCDGRSICGLNVHTGSPIVPDTDDWFRADIHITPEEAEANATLLSESKNIFYGLKDAIERMDRARGILSTDENSQWNMLDTEKLKEIIKKAIK